MADAAMNAYELGAPSLKPYLATSPSHSSGTAGHAAGVLTRLEVSGGPDPLAANMACCVIA